MRATGIALWLAAVAVGPIGAQSENDSAALAPGARGYGLTVLAGSAVERFEVEYVGLLENALGPQQNVILVRLLGKPFDRTGVIAGMSGSPIYFQDQLIGALSLSLGSFSDEALAGVTPIGDMVKIDARQRQRAGGLEPLMRFDADAKLMALFGGLPSFPSFLPDQAPNRSAPQLGAWRPLPLPLTTLGFSPRVFELAAPTLSRLGFRPTNIAGAGGASDGGAPIVPGSAVAVQLVRGDWELAATGTVTSVDGSRLLAFGHPFLQLGAVNMPMVRAEILTVYPSQAGSYKISTSGKEVIGTCRQDRLTGILGLLDQTEPRMIPVEVSLQDRGEPVATHRFEIVNDPLLTPLLLYYGLLNSIFSVDKVAGNATFRVSAELELEGYDSLHLEDLFSGPSLAPYFVAGTVAAVLDFVAQNPFQEIQVNKLTLRFDSDDRLQLAEITRAWTDRRSVAPGERVRLTVGLRAHRGAELTLDTDLKIDPDTPPGKLEIVVADALTISREEAAAVRGSFYVRDLGHLLGLLRGLRPNNTVYVQVRRPDPGGAYLEGRYLPLLPPSAGAILEASQGGLGRIQTPVAVLGESQLVTERVVVGHKRIELEVRRPAG